MSKLLAVIDYQNDFVSGSLGFEGANAIDEGIAQLVQTYLAQGDHVLFTYDTHDNNYLTTREGRALPVPHCIKHEDGWRLYGKTQQAFRNAATQQQIHTIHKKCFGISPTELIALSEELPPIDEIMIVGLVTNICVISNAILLQAQWPEVQITVDASLCGSFDPDLHEKTLDVLAGLQMHIINR